MTFLENGGSDNKWKKQEEEADVFAQTVLIPADSFSVFIETGDLSNGSIKLFAKSIGVAPGIVTGRLHHEKLIPDTRHIGRIRYKLR